MTHEEWVEWQARGLAELWVDDGILDCRALFIGKGLEPPTFTPDQRRAMIEEVLPAARKQTQEMYAKGYRPYLQVLTEGIKKD